MSCSYKDTPARIMTDGAERLIYIINENIYFYVHWPVLELAAGRHPPAPVSGV